MERIGVRELRQHASRYLDMVKAGATVEVTERGVLVALLTPPAPPAPLSARDRLIAEGVLVPARSPGAPLLPRTTATMSSEEALAAEREERL